MLSTSRLFGSLFQRAIEMFAICSNPMLPSSQDTSLKMYAWLEWTCARIQEFSHPVEQRMAWGGMSQSWYYLWAPKQNKESIQVCCKMYKTQTSSHPEWQTWSISLYHWAHHVLEAGESHEIIQSISLSYCGWSLLWHHVHNRQLPCKLQLTAEQKQGWDMWEGCTLRKSDSVIHNLRSFQCGYFSFISMWCIAYTG